MNPPDPEGRHAKGQLSLAIDDANVAIRYREHDLRDGRLLLSVDGAPLDARQLAFLVRRLELEECKLEAGRQRYARLLLK
jgi:hypothetical protein